MNEERMLEIAGLGLATVDRVSGSAADETTGLSGTGGAGTAFATGPGPDPGN